jgi:hypothetical protein
MCSQSVHVGRLAANQPSIVTVQKAHQPHICLPRLPHKLGDFQIARIEGALNAHVVCTLPST